ncbi:MAG: carbohydrate kinase [Gammaproteobacteria bacterium]
MNQLTNTGTIPLVFGEVLFDCFEDGSQVLGGAPVNVASHLQAFGLHAVLISRVGNDREGDKIRQAMREWKLSDEGLQSDSEHPTGKVTVSINQGEPSYDIVEHSAYDYIAAGCLPEGVVSNMLYHGTLALRNAESVTALQSLKSQHPSPIFMDVNLRDPWWKKEQVLSWMKDSTWLKINEHELADLASEGSNDIERATYLVEDCHLSLIIVTRGSKGAIAINAENELFSIKPEAVADVVDTVGAGDAFASVCMLGLSSGWDIQTILNRAQHFASKMVTQRGATISDKTFYQPFIEQWSRQLAQETN